MREYVTKVDRLEEAENLRISEKKETEYKPVVMGKVIYLKSSYYYFIDLENLCFNIHGVPQRSYLRN
jgi:hypothetical protein